MTCAHVFDEQGRCGCGLLTLWAQALDVRKAERAAARKERRLARPQHKPLAVHDRFGCWTVVKLLGRGHRGRSEMRVELRCDCKRVRLEAYDFNARAKVKDSVCPHDRLGRRIRRKAFDGLVNYVGANKPAGIKCAQCPNPGAMFAIETARRRKALVCGTCYRRWLRDIERPKAKAAS